MASSSTTSPEELNEEQKLAFHTVVVRKRSAFITGDAGTGKSFLLHAIVKAFDAEGRMTYVTAPTGIAALNVGGTTVHRFAGISDFEMDIDSCIRIIKARKKTVPWLSVQTLIIDEISMLNEHILTRIDDILRKLRRREDLIYGGIQLVIFGDFLQLPPVEKNLAPGVEPRLCFQSRAWRGMTEVHYLKMPIRQSDEEFIRCLREVRKGKLTMESIALLNSRSVRSVGLLHPPPTLIYSHVRDVERENAEKLASLPGDEHVIEALCVHGKSEREIKAFDAFVNNLNAPKILRLKIGARIMITSNVKPENGQVNGAQGIVTEIRNGRISVLLSGSKDPIDVNLYEINRQEEDGTYFSFKQYPLVLAYAFTIHKVQGLTLTNFAVDLSKIFAPGQAYVALSRARTLTDFYIIGDVDVSKITAIKSAKEYYRKILGQSCSDIETHVICTVCEKVFCDECSHSIKDFMMTLEMCKACFNPPPRDIKRVRHR